MDGSIAAHCRELERCNQRGGRMLSVADLIDAGTLSLPLAAALVARIAGSASFMVGANPGGAGKTTVMCALLNFVPPNCDLLPATPELIRQATPGPRRCYICHEIGYGSYYAYLWDKALRQYCALSACGHILATNLHADTLDETIDQVCTENNIPLEQFRHFSLLIYLRVNRPSRVIQQVYVSNNGNAHTLAYDRSTNIFKPELFAPTEQQQHCAPIPRTIPRTTRPHHPNHAPGNRTKPTAYTPVEVSPTPVC